MQFYKEAVLGTRPQDYVPKYVFLGLDRLEATYLSNRLISQGLGDTILVNSKGELQLLVDATDKAKELLFHIWDWEVFFQGNKCVVLD